MSISKNKTLTMQESIALAHHLGQNSLLVCLRVVHRLLGQDGVSRGEVPIGRGPFHFLNDAQFLYGWLVLSGFR